MKTDSLIGKTFGRLTILNVDHIGPSRNKYYRCVCSCGQKKIVSRSGLISGDIVSCGCYREEHKREFGKIHGLHSHKLYGVWSGIVQRCTNNRASNYSRYGGRGIAVCDEWRDDFKAFYDWAITHGYNDGLTIDRIDVNGNYTPNNCRWVFPRDQYSNKRNTVNITYNGVTHTLAEWSRLLHIDYNTLRYRVVIAGWDINKAFETRRRQKLCNT